MSVTFLIPGSLRSLAGGRSEVELDAPAATVLEALQALWVVCPAIRDRVVTEQGQIREHINIFVGKEHIRYTGGLATPVFPGAEISILPAISGGCRVVDSWEWAAGGEQPALSPRRGGVR